MPKPERRDPAKEKYWRRLLRQWQRSGLTGRDFCAEHGLERTQLLRLATRDRPPRSGATGTRAGELGHTADRRQRPCPLPTFVQVTVDAETAANGRTRSRAGPRSAGCAVAPGFDAQLLRQLLRVLEEPSC